MLKVDYELECTRSNVTVSGFLGYINKRCKDKGINFEISKEDFENPGSYARSDMHYIVSNGKKIVWNNGERLEYEFKTEEGMPKSEMSKCLPYDYHNAVVNQDGSMWNEICEFTFDDENKGTGYFYTINKRICE